MRGRRRAFAGVLIGTALLFAGVILPLPFYLIAPGSAVDLSSAVLIAAQPGVHDRFYLTDVSLMRASPLRLALALVPGVELQKVDDIVPRGATPQSYSAQMEAAMTQSQSIAAVVGERAAGYRIPLPPVSVSVLEIGAGSLAAGRLAIGDVIRRIEDRPVSSVDDVRTIVGGVRAGKTVRIQIARRGSARTIAVRTIARDGRARLGVMLISRYGRPRLAVPVRYAVGDVGGSSGGLMMALRIYDALHGSAARGGRRIAGTGTLALDGHVGPIVGTQQKLIAAKRAGARVFLVPRENYRDIAAEREVRVIPVETFGDAVQALRR
ncbi:MAG: PDZ domain-containing protein [Candidatus Velthaea sp.]